MSVKDLDEHKTVEQLRKENLMLDRELKASLLTIDKLLKDLNLKREEISHLQGLVASTVPILVPKKIESKEDKTDSQLIAETQLSRLKNIALTRQMTLEEVRIYDFLVKNQRIAGTDSDEGKNKNPAREVSEIELVRIAESNFKPKNEE